MAVHGGKPKIRHKNMADGIAKNDGCHGGQKKLYFSKQKCQSKYDVDLA